MRSAVCDGCHQTYPLKDMFVAFGRPLCESCTNADLAARAGQKVPEGAVQRQVDPTICAGCGRDNGDWPLTLLGGGVPVCADCEQSFRNPSFPGWIKAAFAGLCMLMVLSCLGNWRFFQSYVDFRRGMAAFAAQDLASAAAHLGSASERVPESTDLSGVAAYMRGVHLLSQERSAEALPYLRQSEPLFGQVATAAILSAETGAAFDRKDYDEFVAKAKAVEARFPGEPNAVAGVASALACKWAVSGDAAYKQQALERLDRARQLAGPENAEFKEYESRILYRLDSREIITRAEYQRRFPGGYVRKGELR